MTRRWKLWGQHRASQPNVLIVYLADPTNIFAEHLLGEICTRWWGYSRKQSPYLQEEEQSFDSSLVNFQAHNSCSKLSKPLILHAMHSWQTPDLTSSLTPKLRPPGKKIPHIHSVWHGFHRIFLQHPYFLQYPYFLLLSSGGRRTYSMLPNCNLTTCTTAPETLEVYAIQLKASSFLYWDFLPWISLLLTPPI